MNKTSSKVLLSAAIVAALSLSAGFLCARYVQYKKKQKEPHCGGCLMNCPLAAPGCKVGQEKAEKLFSCSH